MELELATIPELCDELRKRCPAIVICAAVPDDDDPRLVGVMLKHGGFMPTVIGLAAMAHNIVSANAMNLQNDDG